MWTIFSLFGSDSFSSGFEDGEGGELFFNDSSSDSDDSDDSDSSDSFGYGCCFVSFHVFTFFVASFFVILFFVKCVGTKKKRKKKRPLWTHAGTLGSDDSGRRLGR